MNAAEKLMETEKTVRPVMREYSFAATSNACSVCAPLGASLAFRGIEGAVPFLHGSQGCATYMRRYIISHYREPMDIASSSLGEKQAVFGGGPNLKKGLLNVMKKYAPALIGVATTCLTETIGDDVNAILGEFRREFGDLALPEIVSVSTPSYSGTHAEGWHAAVAAVVEALAVEKSPDTKGVNIFPGLLSCADVDHLKDITEDFGLFPTILPDIAETLDGPTFAGYMAVPPGGTPLSSIKTMPGNFASIELGRSLFGRKTGAKILWDRNLVPCHSLGLPVGLRESDVFFEALSDIAGRPMPRRSALDRGRLIDAMVDGHKYLAGKRAVVFGEEDLVIGLVSFLAETGVKPVLAATGARGNGFSEAVKAVCDGVCPAPAVVMEDADFEGVARKAEELSPDILVGHGKGYRYAKKWGVPLVRTGFPIHDRFGGQRILHVGYRGALNLYDAIVNAVLEKNQNASDVGYGYL